MLLRRDQLDQGLDDEIGYHVDTKAEENIAKGMTPQEEHVRAARTGEWLKTLVQGVRFGVRILRKSPGFAITTRLTLSLGLAATVAIFEFVDSALIRPLPYPNPSRLMGVFETSPLGGEQMAYSYPNYLDLERANSVFASIAAVAVAPSETLSPD
jgi:macrolide transport system ATP-binding/permease protein